MAKKIPKVNECRTSEQFYNCAIGNGAVRENRSNHPGVRTPNNRFIPIPEHGRKSEPLPPGTASAIRRSFKLEGWMLIPLIPTIGALLGIVYGLMQRFGG